MATALLTKTLKVIKKEGLPTGWTVGDGWAREIEDGYIFLRKNKIITGCIIDIAVHNRASSIGKGPLTLEKYEPKPGKGWSVLCDADTPEQVVAAFITYELTGEYDDV